MFPIHHSLLDADALGAHVAEAFDIGAVDDCRFWRSFINDVYRLDAGGRRWWLRVHPADWRTRAETQGEVEAILAVAAAGGAAARPAARRDGGYISELDAPEGPRSAVLFEDAPGASARLHDGCDAVTAFPTRVFDLDFVVTRPAAVLAPYLDPDERDELARLVDRLTAILRAADGELTTGFCHGDLNCMNLHFAGEMATAIDFDCCAWGWRAFELAGFARGVAYLSKPGDAADALIAAQIEGYRDHRPIAPADLVALPAMLLAQRLWVVSLHLDGAARWGAINFDRPYAARALAWLRVWAPTLDTPPLWARLDLRPERSGPARRA